MIDGKKNVAIIPARGGSKRLPGKNILSLAGKPLVVWSIEAALKSKYIDKVIVSSEDDEILKISTEAKADIIKRPEELATDTATTFDVIKHVLDNIKGYEYVVLLQPTSPLRNEKHIDEAIELLIERKADAVISVCETEHSPLWCNTLPKDRSMKNFLKDDIINKRSQDLEKYYRVNGAIYICRIDRLLKEKTFFIKDNIYAYVMIRDESIDIDTHLDFIIAEQLMKSKIDNNK